MRRVPVMEMSTTARSRVMGTALAILVLCMVLGCDAAGPDVAATRYQCTSPEMQKAEVETRFCSKEGGFIQSFCYTAAIARNCQPRKAN